MWGKQGRRELGGHIGDSIPLSRDPSLSLIFILCDLACEQPVSSPNPVAQLSLTPHSPSSHSGEAAISPKPGGLPADWCGDLWRWNLEHLV